MKMKTYYMGEDVDDMSRERLIEVVSELGNALETTRKAAIETAHMLGDCSGSYSGTGSAY